MVWGFEPPVLVEAKWETAPPNHQTNNLKTTHDIVFLGVDSPFFSIIVLFKNRIFFLWVFDDFLKDSDPWKEWKWKAPLEYLLFAFSEQTM